MSQRLGNSILLIVHNIRQNVCGIGEVAMTLTIQRHYIDFCISGERKKHMYACTKKALFVQIFDKDWL